MRRRLTGITSLLVSAVFALSIVAVSAQMNQESPTAGETMSRTSQHDMSTMQNDMVTISRAEYQRLLRDAGRMRTMTGMNRNTSQLYRGANGLRAAYAGPSPTILIDGRQVALRHRPLMVNGVTWVPLREVADAMNAQVSWNRNTHEIVVNTTDGMTDSQSAQSPAMQPQTGTPSGTDLDESTGMYGTEPGSPTRSPRVIVNGNEVSFSQSPMLVQGTTWVPLRDFAQAIGASVAWDQSANEIAILPSGQFGTMGQTQARVPTTPSPDVTPPSPTTPETPETPETPTTPETPENPTPPATPPSTTP